MRDPRRNPGTSFFYVDISAIDRTLKVVTSAPEIVGSDAPSRARKEIRKGDVLVSTVRPNLNTVAIVPQELDGQIASTGFCILRPNRSVIEGKYLFYFTITSDFICLLSSKVRGAHYPAVSDGDVKEIELQLPQLSEQRRIVEILDQVDALRKKRAEADAKTARFLPALFYKMFGDPATNPKRWPTNNLSNVAGKDGLITDGDWILSENMDDNGRVRLLQLADIGMGTFLDKSRKFITESKFDELKCTEVKKGDVLISRMADPIGRACIVPTLPDRLITAVDVTIVRPDKSIALPEYLLALCNSKYFLDRCELAASGTTRGRITRRNLENIQIPIPPIGKQLRFAESVRDISVTTTRQRQRTEYVGKLFDSLLHRAFTGGLTAKWREAHMKVLLAEMEMQAKALGMNT
jgi:type I restriction enzyme S subunit